MGALYKELGRNDFTYSLGFMMNKANKITSVLWGGPVAKDWDRIIEKARARWPELVVQV